jgi:general secretion pathway protein K
VDECFVTNLINARAHLVFGPLRINSGGGHLRAGGLSPLSLLTFFAAAKKVSAAPHRSEANRPISNQGKANTLIKPPNQENQKTRMTSVKNKIKANARMIKMRKNQKSRITLKP